VIVTLVYSFTCHCKYKECSFKICFDKNLFKEITSYMGWNLYSPFAFCFQKQSVDILLNQIFSPIIVAARSISYSVTSAVTIFSSQLTAAIRPQIYKTYANGEKDKMFSLIVNGTKINFFLLYLFSLPLFLEMNTVLTLWLKNPPEYAAVFTRFMLVFIFLESLLNSFTTAVLATGKVSLFSFFYGTPFILTPLLSWIFLRFGMPIYSVYIVLIVLTLISVIARVLLGCYLIEFPLKLIIKIITIFLFVSLISAIVPVICHTIMKNDIARLFVMIAVSIISVGFCMYLIGLNKNERKVMKFMIKNSCNSITCRWLKL
jgi:O-antigen/teichoic acid export membrane protein